MFSLGVVDQEVVSKLRARVHLLQLRLQLHLHGTGTAQDSILAFAYKICLCTERDRKPFKVHCDLSFYDV